jgi:dTMP kinase
LAAETPRGRFITLEGGEGAGKTTLSHRLAAALAEAGLPVLRTREPGGAPGAEALRGLLLGGGIAWDPVAEAMLMFAARREHLVKTIAPALRAGIWVVCDRFTDSTTAYQGFGHGLEARIPGGLAALALDGVVPDATLVLDLAPEAGMARALSRGLPDRFERMGSAFHARVREGFLALARDNPERCAVLDAGQGPDEVFSSAISVLKSRLEVQL